jgi:proteasome lid subunit RPN8/RPN11
MTRPAVHLPEEARRQIIDHCRDQLPNEACGLLAVDAGRVVKVYPTDNLDSSPDSYTVPPDDHYRALIDAESHGWTLGGVFHSHPNGTAQMSTTDVAGANEPEWLYVVVGFEGGPDLTAWVIEGMTPREA